LADSGQRINPPALPDVIIEKGFWADRQAVNRDKTIPAIYHQMDITGRLDSLKVDWNPSKPKPHHFWDSDVGKWMEAVGYSLANHPNAEFERQVDEAGELLAEAQLPDGYLNSHFIAIESEKRWTNLRDMHELYCAGHLIEGAVAYADATGKRGILDTLARYTDHIHTTFGPGEDQKHGYPGHPELELALVKLYRATGNQEYLNLSKYFVDERGQEPHYFDVEAYERGDDPRKYWAKDYRYTQAHVPIREQHTAVGHSVRACYLYSGVADMALETGDQSLVDISREIWEDLTTHQMYITGGLGPAHTNEGFTFAYDLPNETAYAETCASIALAFWAQRMFAIDPDSRYIDVMERALYNGILSGVSYDGETFFYANPLTAFPNVNPYEQWSGIHSAKHYRRSEWFDCACCPPNLARIVAGVGAYFYSSTADTVYVHLYNQNKAHFHVGGGEVNIEQTTNYPWEGNVTLTIKVDKPTTFDLALRIPDWCHSHAITINGMNVDGALEKGYAHFKREWANGDQVALTLAMPVERMVAHPGVRDDAGKIALQRGPVIYCLEEVDNVDRLANVAIPNTSALKVEFDPALFGGVSVITGDAVRVEPGRWSGGLYGRESDVGFTRTPFRFKAIPYFLWANREPGEMRIWVRES
jgi:DUF1680 family protein